MKKTLTLIITTLFGVAVNGQHIPFESNELYPEGIAYSKTQDVFYVSSIRYGKIGKVDWDGNYETFVEDETLISSIGLLVDESRNLLYACISDPGTSTRTNAATQGKLAQVAAYDLTSGKRKFLVDLGVLNTSGGNFANDLTIDPKGNLYITNSFSPMIFKIDTRGKASVFTSSDHWKGVGFNLNGIVYHEDGYLLTVQSSNGQLYKVDINQPKKIKKVEAPLLPGGDGLVINRTNELVVISNGGQKIYKLGTTDGWNSAQINTMTASKMSFPTTGTIARGKNYVLNAKLDELFDPNTPNTSNFMIQQVNFVSSGLGSNVRKINDYKVTVPVPVLSTELIATAGDLENDKLRDFMLEAPDPNQLLGKKFAILTTDGVEELELTVPLKYLSDRGAVVHIVSPHMPTFPDKFGLRYPAIREDHILTVHFMENSGWIKIDRYLDEVSASEYDAIIVPGGAWNPDAIRVDKDAQRIIKEADVLNKPIMAICHGPLLLVNAEVVQGRTLTSFWNIQKDMENAGAKWKDEAVVVDGNLITSRYPFDLPDAMKAVFKALGVRILARN